MSTTIKLFRLYFGLLTTENFSTLEQNLITRNALLIPIMPDFFINQILWFLAR